MHGSHSLAGEPGVGIITRVQMQEATHKLGSRGQASLAGLKCCSLRKPLTNWRTRDTRRYEDPDVGHHESHSQTGEPRTCVINRVQVQATTEATHLLERRGQASSGRCKSTQDRSHSRTGGARRGVVSRVQTPMQFSTENTHSLESRGLSSSAGRKYSSRKAPTRWRAKDRRRQESSNAARQRSQSLAEEPRRGVVSRVQMELTTE